MKNWKQITVYVLKADNKFIDQYRSKEMAEIKAKKYILKGCKVTIKPSVVETLSLDVNLF